MNNFLLPINIVPFIILGNNYNYTILNKYILVLPLNTITISNT